ncbi:MAG: topology modulation protein [Chloroflexota bacterium]
MAVLIERPAAPFIKRLWHLFEQTQIASWQQTNKQAILTELSLENLKNMKRIVILGSSGSGKSTLARKLGNSLNLPVVHLDRHYWNPGWEPTPEKQWQEQVKDFVSEPAWIIDGNYRSTLDIRLEACDAVIFLDMPPILCVQRAIKRRFQYMNHPRPDIARGCKELVLDPQFPQFLARILDYPKRARPEVLQKINYIKDHKRVIILNSPQTADEFLEDPERLFPLDNTFLESLTPVSSPPQFTTD